MTERRRLDTAIDPENRWVWVCYGGSDQLGWAWATVTNAGGSFYALEYEKTLGHSSLERAVKNGITRVAGQIAV